MLRWRSDVLVIAVVLACQSGGKIRLETPPRTERSVSIPSSTHSLTFAQVVHTIANTFRNGSTDKSIIVIDEGG